jgi:hypothetical protein
LNVALMGLAGVVGLAFLLHTLRRLALAAEPAPPRATPVETEETAEGRPPREPGALDRLPGAYPEEPIGRAGFIFKIWVVIYGLVGAQTGWLLRPFIGSPSMAFTWFREREGNFFQSVFHHVELLIRGG